jgi:hypothetical protein
MAPKRPVKRHPNHRDNPYAARAKRPEEEHAGKSFRVRDRDWEVIWGEGLSWIDANALKNKVVAQRKSTTARVEDMTILPPDWYVEQAQVESDRQQLAAARSPALAAAQAAAQVANQRQQQRAARAAVVVRQSQSPAILPPPVAIPEEAVDGGLDEGDINDLLGEVGEVGEVGDAGEDDGAPGTMPTADQLAAFNQAQAAKDAAS